MGIKTDLIDALHIAMKKKDEIQKNAIRLALSTIKMAEIEKGEDLDEVRILGILQKEIKIKEETIVEAEKANRESMITQLENEIAVLKEFLPPELTDEELNNIITKVISDVGASSIKQMGLVMKTVIGEVKGRAPNDRISRAIKQKLSD